MGVLSVNMSETGSSLLSRGWIDLRSSDRKIRGGESVQVAGGGFGELSRLRCAVVLRNRADTTPKNRSVAPSRLCRDGGFVFIWKSAACWFIVSVFVCFGRVRSACCPTEKIAPIAARRNNRSTTRTG